MTAVVAPPAPPPPDRGGASDLVMFWNLFEAGIDRVSGDDRRWQAQVEVVRRQRPRVLMTTEGWGWHLDERAFFEEARSAFDMDGELFVAKTGCHQAVFWQRDVRAVEFEHVPHALADWHGHGAAVLRLPGWSTPLRFVVAHLDPFSPATRRVEADRLRRYADLRGYPTVLAMDANTVPPGDREPDLSLVPRHRREDHLMPGGRTVDRMPLHRLTGEEDDPLFVDAGAHLGDRRPTFGFHPPAEAPRRIDVFLLTVDLLDLLDSYRVVTDPRLEPDGDRLAASDHRPITIGLRRR
ncbi:endonuclease/exonuclease/phosphatase family protein [Streptomyces alkaliterrae]|nr:endonuclease/exonuclease/phosphatase family protein [Streptomyces alkaliterrae]